MWVQPSLTGERVVELSPQSPEAKLKEVCGIASLSPARETLRALQTSSNTDRSSVSIIRFSARAYGPDRMDTMMAAS